MLTKELCEQCIFEWGAGVAVNFDGLKSDKARMLHPDEVRLLVNHMFDVLEKMEGQGDE